MARRVLSLPEKIERCQAKLAADPHSLAFAQLADAHRRQGRLDEAIQICQEGLNRTPNYASAYMVLGRAQQEKGDLLAAREAFQWVLQIDPESAQALKFLGQIAEARNETPDGLASYRMALIFYPFDKELRTAVERLEGRPAAEVEATAPKLVEAYREPSPPEAEPLTMAVETTSPEVGEVRGELPEAEAEPLATETMAGLYAAQGLHDRAADIYARLLAEAPDREDLAEKYQEALAHVEERAGGQIPLSLNTADAVQLLEAWRDVFRQLRHKQKVPVGLFEAWRDAFRRLRPKQRGPADLLEAWRDAFRRLKAAK